MTNSPSWTVAIVLLAATALNACATVDAGLVVGREKAEHAADTVLGATVFGFCGMPYSTLVRNRGAYPGLTVSIKSLCGDL